MKLFIKISDPKGKLLEAFYVIATPSEDATTDEMRKVAAETIKETLAIEWDIDEEPSFEEPED